MELVVCRLMTPGVNARMVLARLLVATLDAGASVGFLPPPAMAEARTYWVGRPDEQTILLVAKADDRIVGTVHAHLAARSAEGFL